VDESAMTEGAMLWFWSFQTKQPLPFESIYILPERVLKEYNWLNQNVAQALAQKEAKNNG
jgi:hypothetical protein